MQDTEVGFIIKLLKSIQQKQLKQFKSKGDNFYIVIKKRYYGIIED